MTGQFFTAIWQSKKEKEITIFFDEIKEILKDGFVFKDYASEGRGDVFED